MPARPPGLLLIGAQPPPHHGVTTVNETLIKSHRIREHFTVRHLDLSDRRPISTVEKFDWQNVWAALRHGTQGAWLMLAWRPRVIYLTISQKTLGFLRDALFLMPARLLGLKIVVHLHGGNFHNFYSHAAAPLRWLILFCLRRVGCAIVLGENLRGCFDGVLPADRVAVLPNGIPDLAPPRAKQASKHDNEPLRVLYLGTVVTEKGIEVFLDAALRVLDRSEKWEFLVAGPWYRSEERQRLEAKARAHQRGSRITFVGEVAGNQKAELLCSCDIFVFPGIQQEGLPLVTLEAMCAGLPVVASAVGCLCEVIEEGVTGFLVPPGDATAVENRLQRLADDWVLCQQMGAAGRRRYEQLYRQELFEERMTALFQAVAAGDLRNIQNKLTPTG